MEEKLLNLFHDKWFNQNIIFPKNPFPQTPVKSQQILSPNSSDVLVRSFSDQCLSSSTSDLLSLKGNVSPDSVLPETSKKLQTIFSGKEFEEEKMQVGKQGRENRGERLKRKKRREKRGRGKSKSLSELEFEELKGFMDLGFVFSEEDKDSSLASIIPGLQRLGKKKQGNNYVDNYLNNDDEKEEDYESRVLRPYLSEAWEVLEERKMEKKPVINWIIPSDLVKNEIEMKNHLRLWAHTVASFAR